MQSVIIWWSLLGLLATPWVSAVVYRDLELDAVVIDDSPDDNLELETAEETTTQVSQADDSQTCTTSTGVKGTCQKFEQCFPYTGRYDSENFESFQLYEILKESAEPCEGSADLVCCPEYSYGLPTRKPQFEGQTTQASNSTSGSGINKNRNRINENCGKNNYQDLKVVGGRQAFKGEFPYMVALLNNKKQFCGGSLISDQWVLTAAHCIANLKSFSSVALHVGDHDVYDTSDVSHQSRGVKRGFYHKSFSWRNLQNDVALLQMSSPVTLSENVQTVCLSSTEPPFGMPGGGVLSGWGKTAKNQGPSAKLRTVKMKIFEHEECRKKYAKEPQAPPVTTGMVCAGEGRQGSSTLKDACNGDSGGPLVRFEQGKAIQFGIVSWGIGCGDYPGVYTRVDKYLSWITKNSMRS